MPDRQVAYVDVDNTLIAWEDNGEIPLTLISPLGTYNVYPMWKNIHLISELRAVGWQIYVWSQGGADHAERVINLLGLQDKVDLIMSKPTIYVDDLPFESQFIKRVWKK